MLKVSFMKSITSISSAIALSISAFVLGGCGGGSSAPGSSVAPAVNVLAALNGNYVLTCTGETWIDAASGINMSESQQSSVTIASDASANGAAVSMHSQYYVGSTNCAAATLDTDITVSGQLSDKGVSKNYKDAAGNTIAAKVASFTYSGLKLSKGNLTGSLPTFGTTATIAYVLTGNNLFVSRGHRDTDGIGGALTTQAAVKQ